MPRVPNKPRQDATKPKLAPILKEPIRYKLQELAAAVENTDRGQEFCERVVQDLKARMDAVFAHFGIDPSGEDAQLQLMLRMASELFPTAFKFIQAGKKPRGRAQERSFVDQVNLYVVMQGLIDGGYSVQRAATFVREHLPELSNRNAIPSIVTRFSEARKTAARIDRGEITDDEYLEFLASRHSDRE